MSSRASSVAGSSASSRRGAVAGPARTIGPIAIPPTRQMPAKRRGIGAPSPSSVLSGTTAPASTSASSIATVSSTSTSSGS